MLGQIWEIGRKLWLKEHNAVFGLINSTKWPATIEPYMMCLEETYREQIVHLIGEYISLLKCYSF